MTDKCKSCGAEIIWIVDQDGTRLPVNKRRVRVYDQGEGVQPSQFLVWADQSPKLYHISHFVTCPNATKHSKSNADQQDPVG